MPATDNGHAGGRAERLTCPRSGEPRLGSHNQEEIPMLRYSVRAASPAAALIGLVATTASANVLVVDASGGGNYTQIQAAVDAAVDGDTILIESGSYSGFIVRGISLSIVGDTGSTVFITGTIVVKNLHAGQTVVLQDFQASVPSSLPGSQPALSLTNNQGSVRVEGCELQGGNEHCGTVYLDGGAGILADSSSDVEVVDCIGRGGLSATDVNRDFAIGGAGVLATSSKLAAYNLQAFGGGGTTCCDGSSGGDGIQLSSGSFLFASYCQAIGADGTSAQLACSCGYGGDGGNGMELDDASQAFVLGCVSHGGTYGHGAGGFGCLPSDGDGGPGVGEYVTSGCVLSHLTGGARWMTAPSPVHAGTNAQLVLTGASGEHVTLYVSDATLARYIPGWNGELLVDPRPPHGTSIDLGTIPVSTMLTVQLPITDPGVPAKTLYLQAVFSNAQGNKLLGTPRSMVVLQ
jgi:hypothetical protein